jgi:hypothetical protein
MKSSPEDSPSWDGTNTSGFSGLAGGYRNIPDGNFYNEGYTGTWSVSKAAEIKISYTRTTEGYLPDDNTLKMLSCDALQIHEGTVVRK